MYVAMAMAIAVAIFNNVCGGTLHIGCIRMDIDN
jgi:hypothetical protein